MLMLFQDVLRETIINVPFLRRIASRRYIDELAHCTPPRPRKYSLWSPDPKPDNGQEGPITDYTSWPSLTNRAYSGRHLPPASQDYVDSLPVDSPYDPEKKSWGTITSLFQRDGAMVPSRSSLLFMFFAQWFTDSILRIDGVDRRKNTSNHDIDLCQIYGLTESTARLLRTMKGGRLRSQLIGGEEFPERLGTVSDTGELKVKDHFQKLPHLGQLKDILDGFPKDRWNHIYATGLERGNSSIGYVAVSTIFLREHNRICKVLEEQEESRHWNDERLFQTARMINIVLLMKLVVEDYINHILGHRLFLLDHTFAEDRPWYRPNWIALEFDLLYRWHGLVPDSISIDGRDLTPSEFRTNNALLESKGVSAILTLASNAPAGRIGLRNTSEFLLGAEYQSIRMSRAFRLRPYNDYRERFGLDRLRSFSELTSDLELRETLEGLYGRDINRLEFLVGLFAEEGSPPSLFGDLLSHMVAYDAFTQIFSNPLLSRNVYGAETFTEYGLHLIETTDSIQRLVDRNTTQKAKASLTIE